MNPLRHRLVFRLFSLALIPVLLSGCTSWQVQDPPLAPHVEEGPDKVRLTLTDGRELELRNPAMSTDSVVGEIEVANRGAEQALARVAVPLEEIAIMELSKVSEGKTLLFSAGGIVTAFLAFVAVCAYLACGST